MTGTLRTLLDRWELAARAKGNEKGTISIVRLSVGFFADFLPKDKEAQDITIDDFRRFIVYLRERPPKLGSKKNLSDTTINTYARMIKAFFSWLKEEGILDKNPLAQVPAPKKSKTIPKIYPEKVLIKVTETAAHNIRDIAVLLLFLDSGVRLGEFSTLTLANLDTSARRLKVLGKGKKERYSYFDEETAHCLDRYLKEVRSDGKPNDAVFLVEDGHPLSARGVQSLLLRLGRKAGIEERLAPHKLRHTWATLSLKYGANLEYLRKMLGHADIKTTQGSYLNVQDEDVQAAYQKFSPVKNIISSIKGKQSEPGQAVQEYRKNDSNGPLRKDVRKPHLPENKAPNHLPLNASVDDNTVITGVTKEDSDINGRDKNTFPQVLRNKLYRRHFQKLAALTKKLLKDIENGNLEVCSPVKPLNRKTILGDLGKPIFSAQNNILWSFLIKHLVAEFSDPPIDRQIAELAALLLWKIESFKGVPAASLKEQLAVRLMLVSERGTFRGTCEICADYLEG